MRRGSRCFLHARSIRRADPHRACRSWPRSRYRENAGLHDYGRKGWPDDNGVLLQRHSRPGDRGYVPSGQRPALSPQLHIGDASSLRASLDAIDEACAVDPLIAVDEEGGTVVRVSGGTSFRAGAFDSPRNVFSSGGLEAIEKDTHEKNALLSELGIDLNLAPVCDISTDPSDFMYSRSLGQDAETTSQYVKTVVKACLEDDMGCCLKHFPGYGNAMDTHYGAAVNDRTMKQIREEDLMPFKAGIKAGAPSVLISHNIVSALDDRMPASLSPAVHNLLRYDMGFDGVVITDDMSMGAIYAFTQGGGQRRHCRSRRKRYAVYGRIRIPVRDAPRCRRRRCHIRGKAGFFGEAYTDMEKGSFFNMTACNIIATYFFQLAFTIAT